MKKLLSTVLALMMVLTTFAMLVPTASAATPKTVYENNFENVGTDLNLTNIDAKIGWVLTSEVEVKDGADTNHGSAAIETVSGNKVLRLKRDNEGTTSMSFLVANDADLVNGFVIEYDFCYPAVSYEADGTTPKFNKDGEANCGEFVGNTTKGGDSTGWHVQIQMTGGIRNGIRTNKWSANTSTKWSTTDVRDKWYSAKIVMAPNGDEGSCTVYVKEKGASTWAAEDKYTSNYDNVTKDGVIQFMVRRRIDVMLDNVKITTEIPDAKTIKVNGVDQSVNIGTCDLTKLTEGEFAFAVINGSEIVKDTKYAVTTSTTSIDVYSLSVTDLKGASIRTTDDAALRFQTAIAKAEYDALVAAKTAGVLKNVELGIMTMDYATLGSLGVLKMDTQGATKVVANGVSAYGEDNYVFNGVIEVADDKLNTRYAAIGYVTVTFADDSTLTVATAYDKYTKVRSVAEIAQTITFKENHGLTDAQLAVVKTYAAAYVAE